MGGYHRSVREPLTTDLVVVAGQPWLVGKPPLRETGAASMLPLAMLTPAALNDLYLLSLANTHDATIANVDRLLLLAGLGVRELMTLAPK